MKRITLSSLTKEARADIHPALELVRGNGYFYWVFDDGVQFNTLSVYVCRLTQLTIGQWMDEARDLVHLTAQNNSRKVLCSFR